MKASHLLTNIFLAAAMALPAAGANDDYEWREGQASAREFFRHLSDDEFASLTPAPTKFPVLLDAWRSRPLISDDVRGPSLRCAHDEDVERQRAGFVQPDPRFRSRTAMVLGGSGSPAAIPLLQSQLSNEVDPWTRADLMLALTQLQAKVAESKLQTALAAVLPAERAAANQLVIANSQNNRELAWQRVAAEPSKQVRTTALRALALQPRSEETRSWEELLSKTEAPLEQSLAATTLAQTPNIDAATLQRAIAAKPPITAASVLQQLPASLSETDRSAILSAALASADPSIQAAAAAQVRSPLPNLAPGLQALARSPTSEVRRTVAHALAHYPEDQTFAALVELAGDAVSELVRKAAASSLVALASNYPVATKIVPFVTDSSELRREQIYRVANAIRAESATQALIANLQSESKPANVAELLGALAAVGYRDLANRVDSLKGHESPRVRAALARAIGILKLRDHFAVISDFIRNDTEDAVRAAGFDAISHNVEPTFSKDLFEILKRTNYSGDEFLMADDRAQALWLLARMPSLDAPVRERILQHVTHMVIKTPLGPAHDDKHVRVSAGFCLAEQARKNQDDKPLQATVKEAIRVLSANEAINNAPVGPVLAHLGHQIDSWYRDQPIDRYYAQTLRYRMLVEPLRNQRPN